MHLDVFIFDCWLITKFYKRMCQEVRETRVITATITTRNCRATFDPSSIHQNSTAKSSSCVVTFYFVI